MATFLSITETIVTIHEELQLMPIIGIYSAPTSYNIINVRKGNNYTEYNGNHNCVEP